MIASRNLAPLRETPFRASDQSIPGTIVVVDEPVSYVTAWNLQSRLHSARLREQRPDTVLILEHEPVYTLGRSAQPSHWGGDEASLRESGCELCYVNRGGSVTYHGPGQIVAYPILRLTQHASGPRRFVWLLEEAIIRLLERWNIHGERIEKKPGVWIKAPDTAKIASIGIRVEHGVTLHGFALNVDMDTTPFERIQPCGLADCRATSMSAIARAALHVNDLKRQLADVLNQVFAVEWPVTVEDLRNSDLLSANHLG